MRIFGSVGIGPFRFGVSSPLWRRMRMRAYYIHYGCPIKHRSAKAADRCPNGRNGNHDR